MATPIGLSKLLRKKLADGEMTHAELRAAFPQFEARQISNALNQQSTAIPGIRRDGGNPPKYRATKITNRLTRSNFSLSTHP
jgi:hypothetical protein